MIGAILVATGSLLILASLASTRVPGGAAFARPGTARSPEVAGDAGGIFAFARRGRDPVRAFAISPIHPATWYANATLLMGLPIGIAAAVTSFTLVSFGLSILLFGVGLLVIAFAIEFTRLVARIERWRLFLGEPVRPPAHPYRPLRGSLLDLFRAEFTDESRWRDVLYVAINLPLSVLEFVVVGIAWLAALALLTSPLWYDVVGGTALPWYLQPVSGHEPTIVLFRTVVGLALLPVAATLSQLIVALHRALVAAMLCTSESRELRRQVETLRRSRSAVLDVEASELQRIERDLHDGAQQRLVMLSMNLGMASERIDTDPAAAKQLILEGQQQARAALAEIRQLVRGIAPSILIDRGLVAALESIAGRGPVQTRLVSELPAGQRFAPAVERTAYFVVTEALANIAKHSRAQQCEVRIGRDARGLLVEVRDDGVGGARVHAGGGLDGLASRLAAVDGTLEVSSPAGGPTLVRAAIPLVGATEWNVAEPAARPQEDPGTSA